MACDSPYYGRPNGYVDYIPFPCGKCPNCKRRHVNEWAFRLEQEQKVSTGAHFVTLTYNNENVPKTPNGFLTLDKRDVQLFFKRLRYHIDDAYKIKYYVAGEYGDTYKRPHYHVILFNLRHDHLPLLNVAWGLGNIDLGDVNQKSIAYALKYIDKEQTIPIHRRDDRLREFSLKSSGLGLSYVSGQSKKWHKADINTRNYVRNSDGYRVPLPRYLRDKIFDKSELKQQRKHIVQEVETLEQKQYKHYLKHYGNVPDYDYDRYKHDLKIGRLNSFYSQQKRRDYEND